MDALLQAPGRCRNSQRTVAAARLYNALVLLRSPVHRTLPSNLAMQRALVLNWPLAAAQRRTSAISQALGAVARPLGSLRSSLVQMRSLSSNEGVESQFYLHGLECLSPGAAGPHADPLRLRCLMPKVFLSRRQHVRHASQVGPGERGSDGILDVHQAEQPLVGAQRCVWVRALPLSDCFSRYRCSLACDLPNKRKSPACFVRVGKARRWDMVETLASVGVVIYNIDRDAFVIVRQFRPAVYSTHMRQHAAAGKEPPQLSTGAAFHQQPILVCHQHPSTSMPPITNVCKPHCPMVADQHPPTPPSCAAR
jgi:hypothetical protein